MPFVLIVLVAWGAVLGQGLLPDIGRIERKIKPERLKATGYGNTIPLSATATGSAEDLRQLNRRTEFKVVAR